MHGALGQVAGTGALRLGLDDHEVARTELARALLRGDLTSAECAAQLMIHAGFPLTRLYGEVIQRLLDEVGHRWQLGGLRIADEHFCSTTIMELIARLAARPPALPPNRGTVLLVAPPGERHLIGLEMLRHVLREQGWSVSRPDALPLAELAAYARHLRDVRVIGLTVHDAARLPPLREGIGELKLALPRVPVILGGLAQRRNPRAWQQIGADGGGEDLAGALRLVSRLTNPLTARELEVLASASQGRTNEEIALGLGVNVSTVKTHLEHVYEKVGVRDRAASVAAALRRGWMP